MPIMEVCPECDGNGFSGTGPSHEAPVCDVCNGKGQVHGGWLDVYLETRIPNTAAMMYHCDICGEYRVVVTLAMRDGRHDICAGCADELTEIARIERFAQLVGAPA